MSIVGIALLTISGVMAVIAVLTIVVSSRMRPRLLSAEITEGIREDVLSARSEVIERLSHFERLMVAIGTIEFGILAYVGSVVVRNGLDVDHPKLLFVLIAVLFFVVTVAYLHIWKVYMSYATYAVQLELLTLERGVRIVTEVFALAQEPHVPKKVKPVVKAAYSMQLVSMFPVFLLAVAIIGFGTKFGLTKPEIIGITVFVFSWALMYVFPCIIEFTKLIEVGSGKVSND
jgi:hypothetical protein